MLSSLCCCSDGSVGEEHDSEGCAHSSWWKISCELCSHCTIVSVSLDDLTPDSSESGVVGGVLCLVNVSDSLSEVVGSVLLIINTLDVEKSELFMLSALASFETSEHCLLVQSTTITINIQCPNSNYQKTICT